MIRFGVVASVAFVLVAIGMYVLMGDAMDADAALVLRLRAEGEPIAAQVMERAQREETHLEGRRTETRIVRTLVLEGRFASGAPFSTTLDVDEGEWAAHPEGSTFALVAIPGEPTAFLRASMLESAGPDGHQPSDGSDRSLIALISGAFMGLLAGLVAVAQHRRRAPP